MAVNTTVEVVMPPMGDSVSEGTILEWHKQEGEAVSEGETLVEISTDKVDAEVPAPTSGTLVKVSAAGGRPREGPRRGRRPRRRRPGARGDRRRGARRGVLRQRHRRGSAGRVARQR